jgi:hypothetical protein
MFSGVKTIDILAPLTAISQRLSLNELFRSMIDLARLVGFRNPTFPEKSGFSAAKLALTFTEI